MFKAIARYKVQQMLAHSVPGFPSPVAVRKQKHCLTRCGARFAAWQMSYQSSDGRGVYYGEITRTSEAK